VEGQYDLALPNLRDVILLLARMPISFRGAGLFTFYVDPAVSGMANRDFPIPAHAVPSSGRSLNRSRVLDGLRMLD